MDVKAYYKKIREVESMITEDFVVVVGSETPDGGKTSTRTEVSRSVAAKLVADGRGRLATAEETEGFREDQANAIRQAEAAAAVQRMQITVVPGAGMQPRILDKD